MTTPSIVTGFEGWPASPTVNGGGLFNSISGSPTVGAYAHTGSNGLQINPSNATDYISWDIAAGNKIIVSSVWFKMVAAPTGGDYRLLSGSTTAGGQIFVVDTSGRLIAEPAGNGGDRVIGQTLSLDTWYRLDFKFDTSGTNHTIDWSVNGTAQTQAATTDSPGAQDMTNFRLGTTLAATAEFWYDDFVLSFVSGDYPINVGGIERLAPASDGTHNAGTNVMEDNSGADIGVITAYDKINNAPPNTTAYIRQAGASTANYAEVQFEDISAAHASIIGLRATLAYTSATTSANRGACIISKDNFTNSYIIHGEPSIRADYSDGSLTNLYFKSVTISAWNTDSDVNNIKARLGYSDDVTPNPYWIDLWVEVAYTVSTGVTGDIAVTGSASVEAAASVLIDGSASVTGSGQVSAGANVLVSGFMDLTGSGTVAATGSTLSPITGDITVTGDASVSAAASVLVRGAATLTGTASVSIDADNPISASVSLTGLGEVSAQGQLAISGSAALVGTGAVSAEAGVLVQGQIAVVGTATVSMSAGVLQPITGDIAVTGSGEVQATGSVAIAGQVSIVGNSTVSVQANVLVSGDAALVGAGSVSAQAGVLVQGEIAVIGTAAVSMTASNQEINTGAITVVGSATVSMTASVLNSGSIAVMGTGEIAASAGVLVSGAVTVTGSGRVQADGNLSISGSAEVVGNSTVGAEASVLVVGAIEVAGDASVIIVGGTNTPDSLTAVLTEITFTCQMSSDELVAGMRPTNLQSTLTEV